MEGGIYNNGIAEVSDSAISGNQSVDGGGILNYDQLKIENAIFQENIAFYGGGIANYGELEGIASQFQDNVAYYPYYYFMCGGTGSRGAGIYNDDTGVVSIANSLFAENINGGAMSSGGGITNRGHMTIVSSTITQNSAVYSGGIVSHSGAVTELYNTIVAENENHMGSIGFIGDNPDVGGSFIGSNNLIGDGTALSGLVDGVDENQIGTADSPIDPGLSATIQEETGLIQYELLSDSPAIDAGENNFAVDPDGNPLTTDIVGNDRIFGSAVDMGAYECQTPYRLPGDANLDGKVDGSDLTILACNWQTGVINTQYATWSMGDFNGDGKVDGSDVTILAANWQRTIANQAPQLDNPIADMLLEDGDAQPALIDLTDVFSDIDNDLSFSVVSSNTDLVMVQIIDGTKLQVTYLDYAPDQDRTPAEIMVTATEIDGDAPLSVDDTFMVTVTPIQPVEVYLVVRDTATDTTTAEKTTELPTSISTVDVGSSYVVEIWMTNTYPYGTEAMAIARGDLTFDNTLGTASLLSHAGLFKTATEGTIDNPDGEVTNFGGANFYAGNQCGVAPNYSRLGYVEFEALSAGTQDLTFSLDVVAILNGGAPMNLEQVHVTNASIVHQEVIGTYTFDASDSSVKVFGTIAGEEITAPPFALDADRSNQSLSGSLAIKLDDYYTPTSVEVVSGSIDVGVYEGAQSSLISPGVGGINSAASANFGLKNDSIELAIRDLVFGFSSDALPVTTGISFDASAIDVIFQSGSIDYRTSDGTSGRIDLVPELLLSEEGITGGIFNLGNTKVVVYICDYTVDLSSFFGPDSELTFRVTVDSTYDPLETVALALQQPTFQPPIQATYGIATVVQQSTREPRQIVRPDIAAVDFFFSR